MSRTPSCDLATPWGTTRFTLSAVTGGEKWYRLTCLLGLDLSGSVRPLKRRPIRVLTTLSIPLAVFVTTPPLFCTRARRVPPLFVVWQELNPRPTVYQTAALTPEPLTIFVQSSILCSLPLFIPKRGPFAAPAAPAADSTCQTSVVETGCRCTRVVALRHACSSSENVYRA